MTACPRPPCLRLELPPAPLLLEEMAHLELEPEMARLELDPVLGTSTPTETILPHNPAEGHSRDHPTSVSV
uniref:Uncharacterized protein n=1 Tax=Oryza sativa subsp. japonica TaxID=39947 RepID=Q8W5Q1_ORYSJ|nr:hypothetical protein [Oryza sativa Japonica Group]